MARENVAGTHCTVQDFNEAAQVIEQSIRNNERKQDLLQILEKLDHSRNTREYLFYYQQFVDILSHHIVTASPILIFLARFFPSS